MNTHPLKEGAFTENSVGIGSVTWEMVLRRAAELAVINGRSAREVSKTDLEQARRELTGEPDTDTKGAILDQISPLNRMRWDALGGRTFQSATS